MGKLLKDLEKSDFVGLIGETFRIGSYETELLSIRDGQETPPRFRDPFSLTFRTPESCSIGSEVLPVHHPVIGEHNLLVVQVMGWDTPTELEISFT